jgi:hypothetical protein
MSVRKRLLAAALATAVASTLTMTAGVLTAAPASATTPMLFGIGDHWKSDVEHDDAQLRIRSGIVGLFTKWGTYQTDPVIHWMDWVRSRGGAPMIDLIPPATATDGQIAAGAQDGYLTNWAQRMRDWGHPVLLRVLPEMNGRWESYSPWTRGQTPAQYRAAFQHIVTVFRGQGATNVKMVWNPDKPIVHGGTALSKVYPGDAYVDWAALDIYDWRDAAHGVLSPWKAIVPAVRAVRAVTHKPLFFAEIGVDNYPGKARWISTAVRLAQAHGVKAMVWFDESGPRAAWRLDSSAAALRAARRAVHQPYVTYAGRVGIDTIDSFVANGGF